MALLNICAITGGNMVVQVGLAFIRQERERDYNWALNFLRDIMAKESIQEPFSIVTDREIALIRALRTYFPSSQHLLCRWHVNMNVLAKTKRFFPAPILVNNRPVGHPSFQEFLSSSNILLASQTVPIYNQRLEKCRQNTLLAQSSIVQIHG
jgi:transposase-like protein